jgi:hypothetical protein
MAGAATVFFLGGEDEPAPPAEPQQRPLPQSPARQAAPFPPGRAPTTHPWYDYGTTSVPGGQGPYGGLGAQQAPDGSWSTDPYQTHAWPGTDSDAYRFRPLTERERQRIGIPEPAPIQSVSPRTAAPAAPYGSWGQRGYRFRPYAPREGTGGRYEPPYRVPAWGPEADYVERWDLPPDRYPGPAPQPSWDPPSRRMLPSLDEFANPTFTAR